MKITEYKFEWKVIFTDGRPHATGIESVDDLFYWSAYMRVSRLIKNKYKDHKGANTFVKRHQIEE